MRNEITVNGVTLTRVQVEDAFKRINEPEEFQPGDMIRHKDNYGSTYIVVSSAGLQSVADRVINANCYCLLDRTANRFQLAYLSKRSNHFQKVSE